VFLRAYAKYMRQIGFPLSQSFIETTLAAHHDRARWSSCSRALRSGSGTAARARAGRQVARDRGALEQSRICRGPRAAPIPGADHGDARTILVARARAAAKSSVVQVRSGEGARLPEPKPMFEISVYSPRFEVVHLRGGRGRSRRVACWSDRLEDFRTEVLGLMKAQMVKNVVIVPVGSKGGFVLKRAPPATDREAFMKEGVACYQDYLRGLLDITDNRVGDKIVPPPR
jgi:glutamate dehydrogenase